MNEPKWIYLGDGVYAKSDGYGVWLHANEIVDPTDQIYLEPDVLKALVFHFTKKAGASE